MRKIWVSRLTFVCNALLALFEYQSIVGGGMCAYTFGRLLSMPGVLT